MAEITYPASLPAPQRWGAVPRERRAVSPLPGFTKLRARSRDQIQDIDAAWLYKPAEMASWAEWFEATLIKGQRWFNANVPGAGGWIDRAVRFRTGSVKKEYVGLGIWRVTARLEQRGRSVPVRAIVPGSAVDIIHLMFEGDFTDLGSGGTIWEAGNPTWVYTDDTISIERDASLRLDIASPPPVDNENHNYLWAPYVAANAIEGGDFFIGFWFRRVDTNAASRYIISVSNEDATPEDRAWQFATNISGTLLFLYSDGVSMHTMNIGSVPGDDTWGYIAVERVEDTLYGSVHGNVTVTQAFSGSINLPADAEIHIGAGWAVGNPTFGNLNIDMLQVRRLNVYDGEDFTPPTSAIPAGDIIPPTDEEPIDETPPDPDPPTPGDYATPRVLGLDYTSDYSDANVALLAPLPLVLRGMSTGSATTHGIAYVNKLQAINPTVQVAQYLRLNELAYPVDPGTDYYPLFLECVEHGWYVRSQPGNQLVQWTDEYRNYELNPTAAVAANPEGQRLPQFKAEEFDFPYRLDKMPEVGWCFIDNKWRQPRDNVSADYNCDGYNDTPASVGPAWRAGYVAYANALRALRPGLKLIGNVNHSCADPEYVGLLDAGFDEGTIGKSWGRFTVYGMTGAADGKSVRERMLALQANCNGMAIMSAFGTATDYKKMRFGLTMAMIFNAWFAYIVDGGTLRTAWADEYGQSIGVQSGSIPSTPWANGVWLGYRENGIVLCNPTGSAQTVDPTTLGSFTRFAGAQAPTINNGAPVTGPITIAANDGILLLST